MNLKITQEARDAIVVMLERSHLEEPIPSLFWGENIDGSDPGWTLGTYEKNEIPKEYFVKTNNIEFVIEQQWRDSLDGKILDYKKGYFKVIPDEL